VHPEQNDPENDLAHSKKSQLPINIQKNREMCQKVKKSENVRILKL
jgi:hypothetical protein